MRLLVLALSIPLIVSCRGISRHKMFSHSRRWDSPIDAVMCEPPSFNSRLPTLIRERVNRIWRGYRKGDCWIQLAQTRNLLLQLTPKEREMFSQKKKECKMPAIVDTLPSRAQKRIKAIWKERDPKGDCFQQQRKTRLILLNLPATLRSLLHPPAFQCAVPHFIDRLEWELQEKLRHIWDGYKKGTRCVSQVDKQLRLLSDHGISLRSFQMPPQTMFRRAEIFRKLKRSSRARK